MSKVGSPYPHLSTKLALLRGMRLFPYPRLSFGALGTLGSAAFSWDGKVMGSAPVVLDPSFTSSLSWVAFHPATDSANGVGVCGSKHLGGGRAGWGPRGPALGALQLPTTPTLTASPQRLAGLCRAARAFELRAARGNEKPP